MWYITWPEIRSTAVILLILAFGGIMSKGYDQILNMTNAVVRDAAETIDTYIYRITFQEKPKYGFSTAIGFRNPSSTSLSCCWQTSWRKHLGKEASCNDSNFLE